MLIYEYAIDPNLCETWETFKWFYDHFDLQDGKRISQFPTNWVKHALKMSKKGYDENRISEVRFHSIIERLRNINPRLMLSYRNQDDSDDKWVEKATREHHRKPFYKIISSEKGLKDIIHVHDVINELDDSVDVWKIRTGIRVDKKASVIANIAKPILESCNTIIFVDPYFDPNSPRYSLAFQQYFEVIRNRKKLPNTVEIHFKKSPKSEDFIVSSFKDSLAKHLLNTQVIQLFCWDGIYNDEKMHPRFILSENIGLSVDYGLDDMSDGKKTIIKVLDDDLRKEMLKEYDKKESPYFLDYHSIIKGSKEY